jgi:tRNA pseudouridine13 synthase
VQDYRDWIDGLCDARLAPARRALRVVPRDLRWTAESDASWQLEFYLPAGSYATSLLAELLLVDEHR